MANIETLYSAHKALQEQLADVSARKSAAKALLDKQIEELTDQWQASHAELLDEWNGLSIAAQDADSQLRAAAVAYYQSNSASKSIIPGVSIKIITSLKYDMEKSLEWAKKHNLALALDKKAFESIARAQPMEMLFVETIETPTAVIKL